MYRRRSGLSQREASFLLGAEDRAKVCRYEQSHRLPPLRTALAYAAILDVPVGTLFPQIENEVRKEIAGRLRELHAKLETAQKRKRGSARAAQVARWLADHHGVGNANSMLQ
jgi:transcriptional regulator with XRE-family HTH domain